MMNKVMLIGNVGKDPEVKHLEAGNVVANFSLATSERYNNKAGEKVENTEWHNVTAWGKLAEIIEKYVKKGDKIYLEGKIQTRSWEKDGETKYRTEIVANEMKMLGGNPNQSTNGQAAAKPSSQAPAPDGETDDLPF